MAVVHLYCRTYSNICSVKPLENFFWKTTHLFIFSSNRQFRRESSYSILRYMFAVRQMVEQAEAGSIVPLGVLVQSIRGDA